MQYINDHENDNARDETTVTVNKNNIFTITIG